MYVCIYVCMYSFSCLQAADVSEGRPEPLYSCKSCVAGAAHEVASLRGRIYWPENRVQRKSAINLLGWVWFPSDQL